MPIHTLLLLPDTFAISRLDPDQPVPGWACTGNFFTVTRSQTELSIVCREEAVPAGVRCERGWRCLRVTGTLDFALIGVLASLTVPLAEAGVSVFALSTFETDYLLIRQGDLSRALEALHAAGHNVRP